MGWTRRETLRAAFASVAVGGLTGGCTLPGDAILIGGVVVRDFNPSDFGELILVRAVPDHVDGFSPNRPYRGNRVFEANCPLQHTEFPVDVGLYDDTAIIEGAPRRWVMVAWIGSHDREIWPSAGQLYGTRTFEFRRDSYADAWALDVIVELDSIVGQ